MPLTVKDYAGNTTTITLNSSGLVQSEALPAPSSGGSAPTSSYTYDALGNVKSVTNPDGRVDTYAYDSNEDLTSAVTDSGSGRKNLTSNYGYDTVGDRTSAQDPNGNTTSSSFDLLRRVTGVTPPRDNQGNAFARTIVYDPNGRVQSYSKQLLLTGGAGLGTRTTTYTYDTAAENTKTAESTTANGTTTAGDTASYTYDQAGRQQTVTQNNVSGSPSFETSYSFDADGRVISIAHGTPGSLTTTEGYSYEPNGEVSAYSYNNQGTTYATTYVADGFDRAGVTTFPDLTKETSAYTADNDPNYFHTRGNYTITATYDALHRVTQRTGDPTISYTYDQMSRLVSAAIGSSTWTYTYDTAGRLSSQSQPNISVVSYTPDADGNILQEQVAPPAGGSTPTVITSMTYDALSRPVSFAVFGDGVPQTTLWTDQYDADGRVTARTRLQDGSAPVTSSWSYSNTGLGKDLLQIQDELTSSNTLQFNYGYDSTHRATSFSELSISGGQTTDATTHPGSAGTTSSTYNKMNQLTLSACSAKPCYSSDGNLIYDGTRSLTYDQEGDGRIVSATVGSTTATYGYDPQGRRYSKTVNGTTTYYVLDLVGDEVAEITNGNAGNFYLYDASGTAPVAAITGSHSLYYIHADRIGSVVATTSTGSVVGTLGYLPYGSFATAGQGTGATSFGYGGYRWDPELSVYHTQTRSYDPSLVRFLQPDPTEYQAGRNLYAYVGGDPVNGTDPSGLDPSDDDQSGSPTPNFLPEPEDINVRGIDLRAANNFAASASAFDPGLFGSGGAGINNITVTAALAAKAKAQTSTMTATVEASPAAPTVSADTLSPVAPTNTGTTAGDSDDSDGGGDFGGGGAALGGAPSPKFLPLSAPTSVTTSNSVGSGGNGFTATGTNTVYQSSDASGVIYIASPTISRVEQESNRREGCRSRR